MKKLIKVCKTKEFGLATLIGLLIFILFIGVGETQNSVFGTIISSTIESHPDYNIIQSQSVTPQQLEDDPERFLNYFILVISVLVGAGVIGFLLYVLFQTTFWNFVQTKKISLKFYMKQLVNQLLFICFTSVVIFVLLGLTPLIQVTFGFGGILAQTTPTQIIAQIILITLYTIIVVLPLVYVVHTFVFHLPYYIVKYESIRQSIKQYYQKTIQKQLYYFLPLYIIAGIIITASYQLTIFLTEMHYVSGVLFGILATILPFAWIFVSIPIIDDYLQGKVEQKKISSRKTLQRNKSKRN